MTLRFTSPHAAIESMSTAFIACMVCLRSFLMTPCTWKAWRVVMRKVPVAWVRARLDNASHCFGCHHAARQARADHEAVGRLEFLVLTLGAQVAVVLHVAAVELDELRVGVADRARERIVQALDQRAAQAARGLLDDFDRRLGRLLRLDDGSFENFSRHRADTVRQQ